MDIIVAACVSQFHDSEDEFELLLAYNDGREIGHAMTRSAARQIADEIVNAIGDGAPERSTVAGQQLGVSAIEAIEKAMEGVTPGPWQTVQARTDIQWLTVAGPSEIVCGLDGICEPDRMNDRLFAEDAANMRYIAACNPAAMREVLALARQAEALQRENAELREDKARLDFLDACNQRLNSTYGTSYGWKMVMNHNVNRLMTGHHLDVDLNDFEGFGAKSCRQAIDAERRRVEGARRAAPPTSELEAENTRLKARLGEALKALDLFEHYGCPICHGDCASANPPVDSCPMEAASRVRKGG